MSLRCKRGSRWRFLWTRVFMRALDTRKPGLVIQYWLLAFVTHSLMAYLVEDQLIGSEGSGPSMFAAEPCLASSSAASFPRCGDFVTGNPEEVQCVIYSYLVEVRFTALDQFAVGRGIIKRFQCCLTV